MVRTQRATPTVLAAYSNNQHAITGHAHDQMIAVNSQQQQQQHLQGQKQIQHQSQMALGQPPGFIPNNPILPSNGMVPMNTQPMAMNRPSGPGKTCVLVS